MPARGVARRTASRIRQDHYVKLQTLRLVHGHDADAVAALFEDRRLASLRGFSSRRELVDETTERQAAVRLVLTGELRDVQHVGERLLAGAAQHDRHVRPRGSQQLLYCLRDRPVVAPPVQPLKDHERVGYWLEMSVVRDP